LAQDIESLLAALRGDGLSKAADEISAKIASGAKLSNAALKALSTARAKNNKEMDAALKKIRAYEADAESMTNVDKEDFEIQKKIFDQRVKSNKQIGIVTESTEKLNKTTEAHTRTQSNTINTIREYVDALDEQVTMLGLLDRAMVGIEFLQRTWFESQVEFTQAMGDATRQAGLAATQVEDLDAAAGNMRGTFQTLGGSLIGWADSIQFTNEAQLAFRMNIRDMSQEFQTEILATERGLGLSAQQTAQLFRSLQTGLADGNESLGDFTLNLRAFASEIGANSAQLAQDFINSSNSLQRFGRDGTRVFRDVALFANRFGMETERVLQMAQRFDRFGAASENINQLNAMFGTTISSLELMQETDPIRRIEMITSAVQDQGVAWQDMDFAQQQSLATTLGLSTSEAGRLIQGESMAEIQAEQLRNQQSAEALARRQANAQETLFSIIEATSTRFMSWRDSLTIIYNIIADSLSPIFEVLNSSSQETAGSITDMIKSVVQSPEFERTVRDIAEWLASLPPALELVRPMWKEISATAVEMWPVIEDIGSTLVDMFQTAKSVFLPVWRQTREMMEEMRPIWNDISSTISSVVDKLTLAFSAGSPIMNGLQTMSNAVSATYGAVSGLFGGSSAGQSTPQGTSKLNARSAVSAPASRSSSPVSIAENKNYRALSEDAIRNGADRDSVVSDMVNSASRNPAIESKIRSSFNLGSNEDLTQGLTRELSTMSSLGSEESSSSPIRSDSSPISNDSSPAVSRTSAVETAPVAARTASVSNGSTQPQVQIVASDVNIDGHLVGRVMFQISRRA
jgi:hypothetical protein